MPTFSIQIPLPYLLPIPEERSFQQHNADWWIQLSFRKVDQDQFRYTVLTATVRSDRIIPESMTKRDAMQDVLRVSLEYINLVFDAIRFKLDLSTLRPIALGDLPAIIVYTVDGQEYSYVTSPNFIIDQESDDISSQDCDEIVKAIATWSAYPELQRSERMFVRARMHILEERCDLAMVELQTSFEVFCYNTMKVLMLHEGASPDDIEKMYDYAFRHLLEHHIGQRLGIDFNFKTTGDPIVREWLDALYKPRNGIIHEGVSFNNQTIAFRSLKSYMGVRDHVASKMTERGFLKAGHILDLGVFKRNFKHDKNLLAIVSERMQRLGIELREEPSEPSPN